MGFSKSDIVKHVLSIVLIIAITIWMMPANAEKTYAASKLTAPKTNGSVSCWDCVYFGAYPQSDASGNKRDPIKWRVLSVNGDDAFLISDTKLDLERYYTSPKSVTFANSYLKKWLNGTFLNKAFTSNEQNSIKNMHYGKVAVMSSSEAQASSYGFVSDRTRVAVTTNYTQQKIKKNNPAIANSVDSVYGAYWLSDTSNSKGYIKTVRGNGMIDSSFRVDNTIICVRPVLHLNQSSSTWSPAGKVMSNGQTSPSTPAGVTAMKTDYNKINVSWNKVFEADGYEIYSYKNSNYVSDKIISGAGATSCTWTGLTPGNGYQYKVRAFWNVGNSKKYSSFSSTVSVELPKASQTITSKYLSKISKYCSKSTFNLGASAKTALTYKSNNTSIASVDTKGNVKVKRPGTVKITITAKGTKSYYAKTRTITITGKLKAPVAKAKTGSKKGQIKLSWSSVYGAEGYIVLRYDSKKGYVNKWRVNKTSTVNKYKTQYRMQTRLRENAYRYDVVITESGGMVILWYLLLSFLFGIGPIVSLAIIIKNFNKMVYGYNLSYVNPAPAHVPVMEPYSETISRQGVLRCIEGELRGASIIIDDGETVHIGRDPEKSNFIINDTKISRLHCSIKYDANNNIFILTDFSKNGTVLGNGKRLSPGESTSVFCNTEFTLANRMTFLVDIKKNAYEIAMP